MGLYPVLRADAADYPAVAALRCSFPNGELVGGTGTLIAPRLVLTAAHVLFDPARGGKALNVEATFGGPGALPAPGVWVDYPTDWARPQSPLDNSDVSAVDFGVVQLDRPLDRVVTPWRFEPIDDAALTGTPLSVGGYPVAPPDGSAFGTLFGNTAYAAQGAALPAGASRYEEFRLFYPIDTLKGMSGGPVYSVGPDPGTRVIHGVHTAFISRMGLASARRIDDEARNLILGWVQERGGAASPAPPPGPPSEG
ncbi:MAG: trypsin-like peptidase domain-containing protein [Gemmataceae bacterium]|nr:trypsin-like peptidase domain-containing protein [Gemmataceae bacterium]